MPDNLIGLLERADLAIGSCAGVVDPEVLQPLVASVSATRTRLAHPDDVLVVALAGGTGSGKSSLLNALAGEELVDVGGVRPTTSRPAAAVPVGMGGALDGYLDRIEIEERHLFQGMSACLIDLPDTDSVETQHRHSVDAILPLVDLVVWVTDPEKYRDARLHHDYLRPLSAYAPQFVFVLNQIDRLSGPEVDEVVADLTAAIAEDGIEAPAIVAVSASPPAGPPVGLTRLIEVLEARRTDRRILVGKLLTDLARTARALEKETGRPVEFDERSGDVVSRAGAELERGEVASATATMTAFLDSVASSIDGPSRGKMELLAADVASHMQRISQQVPHTGKPARWSRRRAREPDTPNPDPSALIVEAVIRPARAILAQRAVAIASIAELAVEVENMRNTPPR